MPFKPAGLTGRGFCGTAGLCCFDSLWRPSSKWECEGEVYYRDYFALFVF